jgi:hypothetical protein
MRRRRERLTGLTRRDNVSLFITSSPEPLAKAGGSFSSEGPIGILPKAGHFRRKNNRAGAEPRSTLVVWLLNQDQDLRVSSH